MLTTPASTASDNSSTITSGASRAAPIHRSAITRACDDVAISVGTPVSSCDAIPKVEAGEARHVQRHHGAGRPVERALARDPAREQRPASSGLAATTRLTRRLSAGHTSRWGVATRSRTTTSPSAFTTPAASRS